MLVCALAMLGRSPSTLPPIRLLSNRSATVSPLVEGFVDADRRAIQIITSSAVFRRAQGASHRCGDVGAIRKLASIIVHEEWHVRNGSDETGAYRAQLMTLRMLHAGTGDPDYQAVLRALRAVVGKIAGDVTRARAVAGGPSTEEILTEPSADGTLPSRVRTTARHD